jgi:hypothetical protein
MFDLELRGDIYTRGSWAIKTKSTYNKLINIEVDWLLSMP